MKQFQAFGLNSTILSNVEKKGYSSPTPIQQMAIEHIMAGKDLLGIAQTGTGKTAAFSLPIIHRLDDFKKEVNANRMRVLILAPTRELATQIDENIKYYSQGLGLDSKVIFGGVSIDPQIDALNLGQDFVVATPGRLLDLMKRKKAFVDEVDVFILDEADRMLEMGMIEEIQKIIKKLPEQKQTLMFSATMPEDIEVLANEILNEPIRIEVTPEEKTVEKIEQSLCYVSNANKPFLLAKILSESEFNSALVFTRTKRTADHVVEKLADSGIESRALHGDKSQGNRQTTINQFKDGTTKVLVATDIAARGIDIDHITHVINYNLPEDPNSYVHRIGRTARAGRAGVAISFCDGSEFPLLKSIEDLINKKIQANLDQPFHEEREALLIKAGKSPKKKDKKSQTKRARRRRSFKG